VISLPKKERDLFEIVMLPPEEVGNDRHSRSSHLEMATRRELFSSDEDTDDLVNTPLEERFARLGPSPIGPPPTPGPHPTIVLYDTHTVTIEADPVQKKNVTKKAIPKKR
jgi:hypothetical protein